MKAFYFSKTDRKLRFDDNREISVGATHEVDCPLELCKNGLHASQRIIDALRYAPGPILWIVELDDEEIIKSNDKCCSRRRTYLAEFDATDVLHRFARKQAKINIEKVKPYCSAEQYGMIVEYLESGNEEIRSAAESAAADAAWSAAWSAARSAEWSAARSAADAAWSAARSAAESAARSAEWSAADAAWSAARSAANDMLLGMIKEETDWDI